MPEKLILDDGSEREVPTAEELVDLQTKATRAESAEAKLSEIEGDKNWQKVRPTLDFAKKARKILEEKGIKVDDEGNVIESAPAPAASFSAEDIDKRARDAARSTTAEMFFSQEKDRAFATLDKDAKSVAEHLYTKLSQGETLTSEKHQEILSLSISAAKPARANSSFYVDGAPPRFESQGAPSPAALDIANNFGISEDDLKQGGEVKLK